MSSTGVFGYIQQQSPLFVNKLYGDHTDEAAVPQAAWVCRGVLQALCPLAKCYVMRLIFIEAPISSIDIWQWCESDKRSAHDSAIKELLQLRIFSEVTIPSSAEIQKDEHWFVLNEFYRRSIKFGMIKLTSPWNGDNLLGVKGSHNKNDEKLNSAEHTVTFCKDAKFIPSLMDLENFSQMRWNLILEYLVTSNKSLPISSGIVSYLVAAGLMQVQGRNNRKSTESSDIPTPKRLKGSGVMSRENLSITSRGYEYMLLDSQSQVWIFILEFLKSSIADQVEILYVVFMLSFCTAGTGYAITLLSPPQRLLLGDLNDMGLVYITDNVDILKASCDDKFYPTNIAVNILHTPVNLRPSNLRDNALNSMSLTIIVETNFQVVAYVNSNLHMAMMSLFVDTRSMIRFPNMMLGNITRDSAKAAFRLGITAQQIIDFLTSHTHPTTANNLTVIPENVTDQLKLWQAEKKRYICQAAVVIDLHDVAQGKHLQNLYDGLVKYAKDMSVLVWANEKLREFAVTPEGFPHVQTYAETL